MIIIWADGTATNEINGQIKTIKTMSSYTTIGYLQSKMIRMPLSLNREWNAIINGCNTPQELIDHISDKGTNDEHWRLLHAIKLRDELNN